VVVDAGDRVWFGRFVHARFFAIYGGVVVYGGVWNVTWSNPS
jgi:hypothetical protein